jgi:uncharacterized SAM-binding protein YcdF (DUF218 family)
VSDAGAVQVGIDARAEGLGEADLIFVFGTRLAEPAGIAAVLFERRLAPLVVLTGGSSRQADGLNEAEHHLDLLLEAGVPQRSIVVENRSSYTHENIHFALPLILERQPSPRRVIAVVKQNHRRALVLLAGHVPTVERIYSATYPAPATPDRTERELRYLRELTAAGVDPLVADGDGWRRTSA